MSLPADAAPLFIATVALSISKPLPKTEPQAPALILVLPDVFVDGLVADFENAVGSQSTADLLRTEKLPQQMLDQLPVRSGNAAVPSRSRPPSVGSLLRLATSISAVETSAVATELVYDRTAMAT